MTSNEYELERMKVWRDALCAATSSPAALDRSDAITLADTALEVFDARFPHPNPWRLSRIPGEHRDMRFQVKDFGGYALVEMLGGAVPAGAEWRFVE